MKLNTFDKYRIIISTLEQKGELTAYDEELREKLELSPKQIGRLLDELSVSVDAIVALKDEKRKLYKMVGNSELFLEVFKQSDERGWIFQLLQDQKCDPKLQKKIQNYTKNSSDIYLLKSSPSEDLDRLENTKVFQNLKRAVKNREYVKLIYHDGRVLDNQKALKLVFMDNNWYIAHIREDEKLRFSRINFLKDATYATLPNFYQKSKVKKYEEFLSDGLQNSFSREEKSSKKARLKALPDIAKYFDEDMKKFLPSQKFLSKNSDGSVEFKVSFTQEMEILPFVQKWLPDLVILEPESLRKSFKEKLERALSVVDKDL